jgi:hypothetical protein
MLKDGAAVTDPLCCRDLGTASPRVADREEQLWVFTEARASVSPVHVRPLPSELWVGSWLVWNYPAAIVK